MQVIGIEDESKREMYFRQYSF